MAPDADAGKSLNPRPDPFAPLTSQLLLVGDGHKVYVESVGRADGIPAVYLHGGLGSERSTGRNLSGILCPHFQNLSVRTGRLHSYILGKRLFLARGVS